MVEHWVGRGLLRPCRHGGAQDGGVFWGPVGMDRMKLVASSSLPAESLQAPGASSTTKALLC